MNVSTETEAMGKEAIPHDDNEVSSCRQRRKTRKEFTASQKLAILAELDGPHPPSIKQLLAKHNLSKSSFHRWRLPGYKERLVEMTSLGGDESHLTNSNNHAITKKSLLYKGDKKRDAIDPLLPLKRALENFIHINASLPEQERYAIRSTFLQVKARELRNELLLLSSSTSTVSPPSTVSPLTSTEIHALQNFKASKSWSCAIANSLGLLSIPYTQEQEANSQRYLQQAATATSGPLVNTTPLELQQHYNNHPHKKQKKDRVEFTALEKLRILNEIEQINTQRKQDGLRIWSIEDICIRYGTSKSSLHRWKQQQRSGDFDGVLEEMRPVKRIMKDKLLVVKQALVEFMEDKKQHKNQTGDSGEETRVGYAMLQEKALMIREDLMREYEEVHGLLISPMEEKEEEGRKENVSMVEGTNVPGEEVAEWKIDNEGITTMKDPVVPDMAVTNDLDANDTTIQQHPVTVPSTTALPLTTTTRTTSITKEEYNALKNFKASNSWLREVAKKYNFLMDTADDTKLDWKTEEGHRVLYENYYHDQMMDQEHYQQPGHDMVVHHHNEQGYDNLVASEHTQENDHLDVHQTVMGEEPAHHEMVDPQYHEVVQLQQDVPITNAHVEEILDGPTEDMAVVKGEGHAQAQDVVVAADPTCIV